MAKKNNILVDTSVVMPALNREMFADMGTQLPRPGRNTLYWKSQYLRMEFLRRWILTGINIYLAARRFGRISEGAIYVSEGFGRDAKIVAWWQSLYSAEKVQTAIDDSEEIRQFGKLVYRWARQYDLLFTKITPVKTNCKRGELQFDDSCLTTDDALTDFHERFLAPDHKCSLDKMLKLEHGCPGAKHLFNESAVEEALSFSTKTDKSKVSSATKSIQKKLRSFITAGAVRNCRECSNIGDLLIVMEQPKSCVLYHTDHVFDVLCYVLGKKKHVKVKSIRGMFLKSEVLSTESDETGA